MRESAHHHRHPAECIPVRARGRAAILLALLVVAGSVWMSSMLPGMEGARLGIVSFELARTSERATEIVSAWSAAGRLDDARLQLRVDYGYMVAYGLLVSIGCLWARDRLRSAGRSGAASAAHLLAWGALAAAAFDAVENALLFVALRDPSSNAIGFATAAAEAKFALLLAATVLVAWVAVTASASRLTAGPRSGAGGPPG